MSSQENKKDTENELKKVLAQLDEIHKINHNLKTNNQSLQNNLKETETDLDHSTKKVKESA